MLLPHVRKAAGTGVGGGAGTGVGGEGCCCGPAACSPVNTVATKPAASADESLVKAIVMPPPLEVTMLGDVT
jgi:hypothetical protein